VNAATPTASGATANGVIAPPPARRLGVLALVALTYLVVSGGAYGIEDAVRIAGPRLTLLLCVVVPLAVSLPTALMAAELTALMPLEGGFYFWVKAALGPFGGFVDAWLTILYTAVDMAIYPVLFSSYLSFVMPLTPREQIAVGVALVWLAGALNAMGVRPVGEASIALTAVLLAPFAVLVAAGAPRLIHWHLPANGHLSHPWAALGGGLAIVIWNYSGWENLSVVAGEIDRPRRTYPLAMMIALPLVALGYLLPLAVCLAGSSSAAAWRTGFFAAEGGLLAGPALELALATGGAISAFSIFAAAMLWVSRMPYVLAREGYLPAGLRRVWEARATPVRSIVACCAVFSLLVPFGFVALVTLDVFFYMGALALEMMALLKLRRLRPERDGLFMVAGGRLGLLAVVITPILLWLATFGVGFSSGEGHVEFLLGVVLATAGGPVYLMLRRRYGGPANDR
jgi:amino acid transporter